MTRTCSVCHQTKAVTDFHTTGPGGRKNSYCKKCQAQYHHQHYVANKAAYLAKGATNKAAARQRVQQLKERPCMDCGRSYPHYVMDFDHREGTGKVANISKLVGAVSHARIEEEVKKCDLVCANCHRERTHRRLSRSTTGKSVPLQGNETGSIPVRDTTETSLAS